MQPRRRKRATPIIRHSSSTPPWPTPTSTSAVSITSSVSPTRRRRTIVRPPRGGLNETRRPRSDLLVQLEIPTPLHQGRRTAGGSDGLVLPLDFRVRESHLVEEARAVRARRQHVERERILRARVCPLHD